MEDFEHKKLKGSVEFQLSKRNRCLPIVVLILLVIIVGLVAFIVVTYMYAKDLQCDDQNKETQPRTSDNSISFLMFSDVHLDPFYKEDAAKKPSFCRNESVPSDYKAKYGRVGCDSPITLFRNVLSAMRNQSMRQRKVEFILATGDTAAHQLTINRRSTVLEIMNTSSREVFSAFPSIPYFPMIGNNDLPGHYVMPTVNDTWYNDLLEIWQDGILCTKCDIKQKPTTKEELRRTFLKGGYYSANIADGKMTLLVLNSMYWTYSTWKPDAYFTETAQTQMQWLEDQLILARQLKKRVLISSHIAPGIDSYPVTRKPDVYAPLWLKNFTEMYTDLVGNKFSDVVAGQFYAHFHKDSFRVINDEKKDPSFLNMSFILLNPSVSVVYKNNPGFRVVHVDPELQALVDYEQFYMNIVMATEFDNPVWHLDYKFSSKYPSIGPEDKVINGMRIKRLSDGLINQTSDDVFSGFISSRQVRYQPDQYSRFIYYCAVRFLSQDDFNKCQDKYKVLGG